MLVEKDTCSDLPTKRRYSLQFQENYDTETTDTLGIHYIICLKIIKVN